MNLEDILLLLRHLSKTLYWQSIYGASKEINFKLFKNVSNLTNLQIYFLNYLASYNSLYTDIALGEVEEKVLENNIYEDAYLYYRQKKSYKYKEKNIDTKDEDKNSFKKSQWIFKKPKRR